MIRIPYRSVPGSKPKLTPAQVEELLTAYANRGKRGQRKTMKQRAAELGVCTATLYHYTSGKIKFPVRA